MGFTASTELIEVSWFAMTDSLSVCPRRMFALTAAAFKGVPSWNLTPWRSVKVRASPLLENFHAVASPGEITPWVFSFSNVSNTGDMYPVADGRAFSCGS